MPPAAATLAPTTTLPAAPAAPKAVKLTVANVTQDNVLLFYEGENGKLVFSQKVPYGEAVDVETTTGKRWVAIFIMNPASETHVVTDSVPWLLRPTKEAVQGTSAPSAYSGSLTLPH
jgi:hypothetical protein